MYPDLGTAGQIWYIHHRMFSAAGQIRGQQNHLVEGDNQRLLSSPGGQGTTGLRQEHLRAQRSEKYPTCWGKKFSVAGVCGANGPDREGS